MKTIRRWIYIIRTFKNHAKDLNRRAGVEQELWNCYHGKRELPDKEQCKKWALTLGVPDSFNKR